MKSIVDAVELHAQRIGQVELTRASLSLHASTSGRSRSFLVGLMSPETDTSCHIPQSSINTSIKIMGPSHGHKGKTNFARADHPSETRVTGSPPHPLEITQWTQRRLDAFSQQHKVHQVAIPTCTNRPQITRPQSMVLGAYC